jgi:hypothetical protein
VVSFFSEPEKRILLTTLNAWTAGVAVLVALTIAALVAAFPRRGSQ